MIYNSAVLVSTHNLIKLLRPYLCYVCMNEYLVKHRSVKIKMPILRGLSISFNQMKFTALKFKIFNELLGKKMES